MSHTSCGRSLTTDLRVEGKCALEPQAHDLLHLHVLCDFARLQGSVSRGVRMNPSAETPRRSCSPTQPAGEGVRLIIGPDHEPGREPLGHCR